MTSVRGWFTAAAVLAFASVVMGTVVCATESGAACPNWPGCYPDQFVPHAALNPWIEFSHRLVAGLTGPVVLVAALVGRRLPDPRPRRLAWLGLAGALSAGVFGMLIVTVGIPWWLGLLDLASALLAVVALVLARALVGDGAGWTLSRLARLSWTAVGGLVVLHLLGLAVVGPNSFTRCLGWPLGVWGTDRWPVLQWLRIVLAAGVLGVLVLAVRLAWRTALRPVAWVLAATLAAEVVLGMVLLAGAQSLWWPTLFGVAAAGVFGATALLAAQASTRA